MKDAVADAFRGLVDRENVVVEFGNSRLPGGAIALSEQVVMPVDTAKRLVLVLEDALRKYAPQALSAEAAQRAVTPVNAPPDAAGEKAALLQKLVADLGVPFQHERSFRVSPGALHANRFLLSLDAADIVGSPMEKVLEICARFGIPEASRKAAEESFGTAACVHFGFEETAGSLLCKLYLERQVPAGEAADAAAHRAPVLLHLAFKWDPASGAQVVTRYNWYPSLPMVELESRLASVYRSRASEASIDIARAVLRSAAARAPAEQLQYLEVEEENGRHSFDLNVYNAALLLKDIQEPLIAMRERFAVRPGQFQALYDQVKTRSLGHLAGGVHRNGEDFFNVYYGVSGFPRFNERLR
ncbi:MAG: hypothetical protein A3H91_09215 [Gammaproteobacteria bacterium RIFCSPLOWO2_02_FULL_61_13]|nr:MAG: hypothetical protein A3H91_09215 [Gammaproteobacteria bacterium RIFCSPLOWO2_02_FULL_61_13]